MAIRLMRANLTPRERETCGFGTTIHIYTLQSFFLFIFFNSQNKPCHSLERLSVGCSRVRFYRLVGKREQNHSRLAGPIFSRVLLESLELRWKRTKTVSVDDIL